MAGQEQRGSRGRGRSPRRDSSSLPRVAASAVASGAMVPGRSPAPNRDPGRRSSDLLLTGTTYRALLMRGLGTDEAANLTAFLCGIPIGQVRWSLRQVNQLLFLREMARTGRFGAVDGEALRPH